MDLPVIDPPIFPRWIWIEEITYSHIPIATLVTAFVTLAPIYEYIGLKKNDIRYDRLARSMITFSLILFSPGAALGTGIPMWIMGTYPEFWSRWANLFFWPLIAQFGFFLGEVIFLFFAYYLTWDRFQARNKRLHIFFGCMAALFGLLVQAVWDSLGGYMLTPSVSLPGVHEPVAWSAAAFFNPSFPFLFGHRFFGNISYAMLLTGGVFALRLLTVKDKNERDYFQFVSKLTFTVGFIAFFAMPFIGWGYAGVLKEHAPVAFHAIMGGHVSPHFSVKMVCIAIMVVAATLLVFQHQERKTVLVGVGIGLIGVYLILMKHPPIFMFAGKSAIWRFVLTVVLLTFLLFLWRKAGKLCWPQNIRQWCMFGIGIAAFSAFLIGGFVRERSRSPYTVYGEIEKPEAVDDERDRFLFYSKCLVCHQVADMKAGKEQDWQRRVMFERQSRDLHITDTEADRIITYLEKAF